MRLSKHSHRRDDMYYTKYIEKQLIAAILEVEILGATNLRSQLAEATVVTNKVQLLQKDYVYMKYRAVDTYFKLKGVFLVKNSDFPV